MSSTPYANLDNAGRYAFHAKVYAFRRVVLGMADTEQSHPGDPDGVWFDPGLVDAAVNRLRSMRMAQTHRPNNDTETHHDARQLLTEYVRQRGADSIDHWCEMQRCSYVDLACECMRSLLIAAERKWRNGMSETHHTSAAQLGVRVVREYAPTAEQMSAGRVALGLEQPLGSSSAATP